MLRFFFLVTTMLAATSAVTTMQEAQAIREIVKLLPDNNAVSPFSRTDVIGGIVRLAFHDAGTFDQAKPNESGRSDGCVDLNSADNAGLGRIINLLSPVVESNKEVMSRADVWALASAIAIKAALPNNEKIHIPIKYGRIDAVDATSACRETDFSKLPSAELSHQHTTTVFAERMGFTQTDITALMGAHTLGRADSKDSGYDGTWVRSSATFDNSYYNDIIRRPWNRETNNNGQHFWVDPNQDGTIMLNTDMALAFDIGDNDNVNSNNCRTRGRNNGDGGGGTRRNDCPSGNNADLVQQFADNQQLWYKDFSKAWIKLIELGYGFNKNETLALPVGNEINIIIPTTNNVAGTPPSQRNNNDDDFIFSGTTIRVTLSILCAVFFIMLITLTVYCCRRNSTKKVFQNSEDVVVKEVTVVNAPTPTEATAPNDQEMYAIVVSVPSNNCVDKNFE